MFSDSSSDTVSINRIVNGNIVIMLDKKGTFVKGLTLSAGVYLVCLIILIRPLQLSTTLLGRDDDTWIFYWNDWWLQEALLNLKSPLFTEMMFAPAGTSLLAHSNSFLNSLFAFPLTPFVGSVAAYNFVLLFGLWIGAVGMFLLVWDSADSYIGALFAGLLFSIMPYHLTRILAHGNLSSIHWWPWFMWALMHTLQHGRRRHALLAGLFAALTFWSGLQLALLLLIWSVVYLIWSIPSIIDLRSLRREDVTRLATSLLIIGGVAIVLCLPLLIPLIQQLDTLRMAAADYNRAAIDQTDLLAYVIPPDYNPFFGSRFEPLAREWFDINRKFVPYLGLTPLMLAIGSVWRGRDRSPSAINTRLNSHIGFWVLMFVIVILLALGTQLRIAGNVIEIPLPYRLLESRFPFSTLRSPDRFNLLTVLILPFLAGSGLARLWQSGHRLLPAVAVVISICEFAIWPLPTWALPPISPVYAQFAAFPDRTEAILDYPTGYGYGKRWLYYQTLHHHPTVDGHMSRYDETTYATILSDPLLQAFYKLTRSPKNVDLTAVEPSVTIADAQSVAELRQLDVRYVVHHHTFSSEEQVAYFAQLMPYVPVYADETVAVYDLDNLNPLRIVPQSQRVPLDMLFAGEFALLQIAWEQVIEVLEIELDYEVQVDIDKGYKLFIHLRDSDGHVVRQYDAIPCQWTCPSTGWTAGAQITDHATLDLFGLSSGIYEVSVGFYNEQTGERLATEDGRDLITLAPQLIIEVDTGAFQP